MTARSLPRIERLAFLDGQPLVARDLNDAAGGLANYRALHARYLHRTWGIAIGFSASVSPSGDGVVVAPGYAIDAEGREVVLLETTTAAAPNPPAPSVLLLSAFVGGVCEWQTPLAVRPGDGVPLAAAYVEGGHISGALDFGVRRYARSFAVPKFVTGSTGAGQTGWSDSPGPGQWIEAIVDTTSSGFVASPQYFASLSPPAVPLSVVSTGPQSFTVRAWSGALTAAQAEAASWIVAWVGVESGVLL